MRRPLNPVVRSVVCVGGIIYNEANDLRTFIIKWRCVSFSRTYIGNISYIYITPQLYRPGNNYNDMS